MKFPFTAPVMQQELQTMPSMVDVFPLADFQSTDWMLVFNIYVQQKQVVRPTSVRQGAVHTG